VEKLNISKEKLIYLPQDKTAFEAHIRSFGFGKP
jgi:hypothetical protein